MTIWAALFADGWNAEQNSRGEIGCGGGGTPTAPPTLRIVRDGAVLVSHPGRAVGWLDDEHFVFISDSAPTDLSVMDLRAPQVVGVSVLARNAAGNTVCAADGHWLSVTVFGDATGYVKYDGRDLYAGALYNGGAVAGDRAIIVIPGGQDGAPHVQEFVHGAPARLVRLPANGNSLTLHADGWIGAGHFGESWLLAPGAKTWIRITVTPWALEGPPTVVLDPRGVPWAWTATASPAGRSMVLGRPAGFSDCLIIDDLPCAWLRVRLVNGQWSIVAVDGAGQLRTTQVPLDAPRRTVPPGPVPPPPPPDPDMRHAPGVTIDMYDTALPAGGDWRLVFHDRNDEAPTTTTVTFHNGYLRVAMKNAQGEDISGATNRRVTITP